MAGTVTWAARGTQTGTGLLTPAFFRYPYSLSSPIEAIRQDSVQYVIETIQNAVAVGCKQVLIVPSHSLQGQTIDEARRFYLDSLASICLVAEEMHTLLGLEIVYPNLSDYMCSSQDAARSHSGFEKPLPGRGDRHRTSQPVWRGY